MTESTIIYLYCELCGEETPHHILKGTMGSGEESGFSGTVQCNQCGSVHHARMKMEKPLEIGTVISDGPRSEKTQVEFFPKEIIRVGDEIAWEGHNLLITSIESNGRRVERCEASTVDNLWMKTFDTVDIKVAVVQGPNTKSEKMEAAPEEEFAVGDLIEFGRSKVVITKIKSDRRMIYREGSPVEARDIKRVYTKRVNERRY